MTLVSLPILLYLIPITVLAAALVPPERRPIPLSLGGMVYCCLIGGWECLTILLLLVVTAWFTLRLQPKPNDTNSRTVKLWMYGGIALQILLLFPARALVPFTGCLPLLLCAMQGIQCITEHAAGKLHTPALLSFLGYECALPRLFAGPVLGYLESRNMHRSAGRFSLQRLGEGAEICVRGLFQTVLLSLPMQSLWESLRSDITLTGAPDALLTLPVIYFTIYYRYQGAAVLGQGIAHMLGMDYEDSFDAPILAVSIKGFWTRSMISLTAWARRFLLPDEEVDCFAYFARILPLMGGIGLVLTKGIGGMLFGIAAATLLTAERALSERLAHIPKAIRHIATAMLLLFCFGLLFGSSQNETLAFFTVLLGKNGIALSAPAAYLFAEHWAVFLCCIIGLFPLRKILAKWIARRKLLFSMQVILIPLTELAVLLLCMSELFSRFLR